MPVIGERLAESIDQPLPLRRLRAERDQSFVMERHASGTELGQPGNRLDRVQRRPE